APNVSEVNVRRVSGRDGMRWEGERRKRLSEAAGFDNRSVCMRNRTDLWWVIPGVLAGTSMPFIHPARHDTPRAALDQFVDELPLLWKEGIRAVVSMLNNPGATRTYF